MNKGKHVYDGKIAGLYDLEDTLGRGHFAVVKLARHVFTGEKVAVKVIDKTKLDEVSRSHLFQEVRCMKLVQHPNVVRLYEVIDTQTKLYLILELGDGGDMYDYIMKHEKGLDEESAKKYFRQIVHAISYCHRLHVVHRDLKPENVVFFEKLGMVKLTDFGFSNRFCPGQKLETSCGSLAYSAPEILLGDLYDAPAVDVWSLGVILYMLVCGHAPFQEANDSETLTMIMDCKYTIPSYVSPDCSRLIQKMLIRDPEKRATLEEIATDPWLGSGSSVQYSEHLPLVSREHLSEEDHTHIIQKMVSGNIALQEEILEALDKDAYNHVTATYFLLAERKLRALRQERAKLLNATHVSDLSALAISPRNPMNPPCPMEDAGLPRTVVGLLSPQEKRRTMTAPVTLDALQTPRIRSRSDVNPPGSPTAGEPPPIATLGTSPIPKHCGGAPRSLQRKCDGSKCGGSAKDREAKKKKRLSADLEQRHVTICAEEDPDDEDCSRSSRASDSDDTSPGSVVKVGKKATSGGQTGPNNRKLHSVRSSPQLTLNEIYEEGESECEAAVVACAAKFHAAAAPNSTSSSPAARGVLKAHHSVASSPAVLRKYERRVRYAKARTASCSSSDASDDDQDQRKRKANKLKQLPGWRDRRRDEEDDGGDGAGPNGGPGHQSAADAPTSMGPETNRDQEPPASNGPTTDPSSQQQGGGSRRPTSPCIQPNRRQMALGSRTAAVALMDRRLHKSSDELHAAGQRHGGHYHHHPRVAAMSSSSASDTSSRRSRSPASITRSLVESSSPPPSPLATPNITSLRQSKTLNQLNRFVSPPTSLPSSPVLDVGDKENSHHHLNNQALSRHCTGGPLHLLNLRRPGKWRPPSCPVAASGPMAADGGGGSVDQVALAGPRSHYKAGLCRLLKYAPGLGLKRLDINRNGLNASPTSSGVGSPRSSNYSVRLRVAASPGPPSGSPSSSHSKCCSLC